MKKITGKWMGLKKLIYQKLISPLVRSKHPPVYKARGVAVGLGWAMTPLVGIQMPLVGITWVVAKFFKWSFSLPLALAWTWVTNVFTMVPAYYVFYITGQILRGRWNDISGYNSSKKIIEDVFLSDVSFFEQTRRFLLLFLQEWGISLFVGCVPWVIAGIIGGYYFTLRFEERRLKKKSERM